MPILDDLKDKISNAFPQRSSRRPRKQQGMGYTEGAARMDTEDDMIISKPAIVFHTCQAFFAFLAMACFASVASFQARFKVGPSGLSGFAIFVAVTDLVLALFILLIPVAYEKYDRFNRLARALKEDRVAFILIGWGTVTMLLISFITTISAWTEPGCKDPDKDPHASIGDSFKNGLSGWCDTKKAGAIFFWLAAISWGCSAVLTFLDWRSGKRSRARDPPFVHPTDPSGYAPSLAARDEFDADEEEAHSPYSRPPQIPPIRGNSGPSPFSDENRYDAPVGQPRPSIDAYGAFSDPAPSGYGRTDSSGAIPQAQPADPPVSRTMQYADPYAAIKANLSHNTSPARSPGSSTPPSYEYPNYQNYR